MDYRQLSKQYSSKLKQIGATSSTDPNYSTLISEAKQLRSKLRSVIAYDYLSRSPFAK